MDTINFVNDGQITKFVIYPKYNKTSFRYLNKKDRKSFYSLQDLPMSVFYFKNGCKYPYLFAAGETKLSPTILCGSIDCFFEDSLYQ